MGHPARSPLFGRGASNNRAELRALFLMWRQRPSCVSAMAQKYGIYARLVVEGDASWTPTQVWLLFGTMPGRARAAARALMIVAWRAALGGAVRRDAPTQLAAGCGGTVDQRGVCVPTEWLAHRSSLK